MHIALIHLSLFLTQSIVMNQEDTRTQATPPLMTTTLARPSQLRFERIDRALSAYRRDPVLPAVWTRDPVYQDDQIEGGDTSHTSRHSRKPQHVSSSRKTLDDREVLKEEK